MMMYKRMDGLFFTSQRRCHYMGGIFWMEGMESRAGRANSAFTSYSRNFRMKCYVKPQLPNEGLAVSGYPVLFMPTRTYARGDHSGFPASLSCFPLCK
jgi:hypothetical protein